MLPELLPQALAGQEGPAYWFLNNLITVKATTASTGGAFSLCHQLSPPGSATPYHLHHNEDEAFYILNGESIFTCDGKKTVAGPGAYLFLPRGIPHGIRVTGAIPTEMLILAMPGDGFVGMMEEMGEPASQLILPSPKTPDMEKLISLCAKYQIDILGPIPE
jgi:mannose-6-phosphate isomerase-like protein (cupin superfamily)